MGNKFSIPSRSAVIGALLGSIVACWPGQLPRTAMTQGLLLTACIATGAALGAVLFHHRARPCATRRVRVTALVSVSTAVGVNGWWQDTLHTHLGGRGLSITWWLVQIVAIAVTATVMSAPRVSGVIAAVLAALASSYAVATATPAHTLPPQQSTRQQQVRPHLTVLKSSVDGSDISHRAHALAQQIPHSSSAVVIAIPTGSGWVDTRMIDGVAQSLGSDATVVSLVYAHKPSWWVYVTNADAARHSAIALTRAVATELNSRQTPPPLYLYGQSLGAVGVDAARNWAKTHGVHLCQTRTAGPPAASYTNAPDNSDYRMINSSDPVVNWSPRLIWDAPRDVATTRDLPRPPWLPFASFVQTTVDLFGALDMPAGHGHRYTSQQSSFTRTCT